MIIFTQTYNMKKQFTYLVILFTITIFIFSSCKKDNNSSTPTKTKTELITSSSWKFESATASGTDVSNASQLACFKDNTITFSTATTGNINEGTVICSPPTAGPFTWNFTTNETVLVFSTALISGGNSTFNIVTLNATNLVISQNVNFPPLTLVTITFKH